MVFEDETVTYDQLWRRVVALAAAYAGMGIGRGDRVVCALRNCPEHVVAMAAAWARGAVHVGADNDLTGAELARLVERLGASALVFQPRPDAENPLEPAHAVARRHPDTRVIIHGDDAGEFEPLDALLESGRAVAPELPAPLDPALIFLTSGTTGEPKAVVEPLAEHWAKMQFFADAISPGTDDVHLLFLPMSHVFGCRLAMMALLRGGTLIPMERFSPARVLDVVASRGVTILPAVPAHLRLLRARRDPHVHDVRSLRWIVSAASGLPRPLAEWVYEVLRSRMLFVYGCSEGFTILTTEAEDILSGSVGSKVFVGPAGTPPDGRVRIIDPETGRSLEPGETGEIAYGSAVPVPYWDQPPAATDGWYRTGDLGHMDERGRVFITGRLKELINRGGLHVSPAEVEAALLRHPKVADAGVIAVPDEVVGEAVCACIVPEEGAAPDLAELRGFLASSLARHKLPDELCVVAHVPRTEIGKVDRAALSEIVVGGNIPRRQLRAAR